MPRAATATSRDIAAPPPDGFALLDEDQIEAQTDAGSFDRGQSYYRTGKIFEAVRRGASLRAQCRGSSGGPYRVEATLATAEQVEQRNPVAYDCDCPRGGFCKHVVALLLTWVHTPEMFEPRPPVAELLAGKSQEELVALVELLLHEAPELEAVIELPPPVAADRDGAAVDEATVRRQIADALRGDERPGRGGSRRGYGYDYDYDYEYHAGSRLAAKLGRLVDLGSAYADAGRWHDAVAVFAPLIEAVAPVYETVRDDDGELGAVLVEADGALAAALAAQGGLSLDQRLSPGDRARLIEALFTVWLTDIESGGHDLSQEGPEAIATNATAEEQTQIAGRLRAMVKAGGADRFDQSWRNRAAIGFLSMLGGDAGLSDEELLAEYRNVELWDEAATLLLDLGRVEEAIALAARRLGSSIILTRFADRLVATGDRRRIDQAIELVESCLWEREGQSPHDDVTIQQWLERHYAASGRPRQALETARRRFKTAPSKTTYDSVKTAALLPDQPDDPWPTLRPELIAALRKRGDWGALVAVHLDDGEVADALAALKQGQRTKTGGYPGYASGWGATVGGESPEVRVARAAEHDFPDDAIAIYLRLAERQIEARSRPYYQEAARFMARIKGVMDETGRRDAWRPLIDDLRQRHKRLRALREELDALDLK